MKEQRREEKMSETETVNCEFLRAAEPRPCEG